MEASLVIKMSAGLKETLFEAAKKAGTSASCLVRMLLMEKYGAEK